VVVVVVVLCRFAQKKLLEDDIVDGRNPAPS